MLINRQHHINHSCGSDHYCSSGDLCGTDSDSHDKEIDASCVCVRDFGVFIIVFECK